VIMNSGEGGGMPFWRHVIFQIGAFTRACIYDRAGYGFSDPATRASDATNAVDDLHRLLKAGVIPAPIVYVGHSIAGLYGVLFAATYPGELAGAVLINPSIAHQDAITLAWLTPAQRAAADAATAKATADMKNCLSLARAGALRPPRSKAASDCLDRSNDPEKLDDALTGELNREWSLPPTNAAYVSEDSSFSSAGGHTDLDSAELDAMPAHFGDKPLIILTPAPQDSAAAQDKAYFALWSDRHDELAKLSSRGSNIVVHGTGDFIQIDRPRAVIDAVRTVVTEARAKSNEPRGKI
jgi:pimeloyl-ACP methyl ester carboxylesterase